MAGINKKTWKTKNGIKYYYEITYYENGKQKKKGGYKSKLEAQIALKDVVTERNTEITLNKLSQQYLERHCTLNCKNSTITLYESYLKTIKPLLRIKAKDITKRHIENLILELKTRDMSNKSINGIVTFIQAILNYAVDNELISNNPIIRLKKLPQVKPPINFLNETQIDIFLQQAETCPQTYKVFFYTAIFTGMRRGELLALEWSDINFKQNKIRVNKQIYRGITQTTKTGKERYIDMSERLKDVLIEHKSQGILSKYVFHVNGKPLHPWNMEETYFKPLLKRCNKMLDEENQIKTLRFHDLRHTYATYLLSKNIPIKYVQQQLGHSTARMTLDTYANILPTIKNNAMDILNSLCYKKEKEAVF